MILLNHYSVKKPTENGNRQMKNESVAVLDVRSYEVTFLIGARGVNGTFVFRGIQSENYDGYTTDGFFDEGSFINAVKKAVKGVLSGYKGKIGEIYICVPSVFTKVHTRGQQISFPSKRKITKNEIEALFETGLSELIAFGRYVHHSEMYLSVGDNRKYFSMNDLLGTPTASLQGGLCYYFAKEDFCKAVSSAIDEFGFEKVEWLPAGLAQCTYLINDKFREGYAFLLDVGYMTSSLSVVYGNGIVHEINFDGGIAPILVSLMQEFDVPIEKAEEMLSGVDVSGVPLHKDDAWTDKDGNDYFALDIQDIVKCGLDEICEQVDAFFEKYYSGNRPNFGKVISITGEGVAQVKGCAEHFAARLGRMTETVMPEIPYLDKPAYSSRIAVLSMAVGNKLKNKKNAKFAKLLFGGRK